MKKKESKFQQESQNPADIKCNNNISKVKKKEAIFNKNCKIQQTKCNNNTSKVKIKESNIQLESQNSTDRNAGREIRTPGLDFSMEKCKRTHIIISVDHMGKGSSLQPYLSIHN